MRPDSSLVVAEEEEEEEEEEEVGWCEGEYWRSLQSIEMCYAMISSQIH